MKKVGVIVALFLVWIGLGIGTAQAAQRKITVGSFARSANGGCMDGEGDRRVR
jgi:hypothetical protein